ncbi:sn-glycerol-3-phosphate ABC transporter ATP-binding protein UgpC [Mesorhizobium sp. M0322]
MNVDIADGEFVILVGPSGCGKSTLLRMIAGLEPISGGEISIGGRVVNDVLPKDRDIAMVFQNYALYPHKNVADNMGFSLKIKGRPKAEIEAKVKKAADILDLGKLLDRFPKQLSGGQRQRVAMGRAIVRDPEVFLFDEPLSNLDAQLRVAMRVEIKELHQRLGTTIVYVTHDQIEAMTMADKIVVMKDGKVEQVGAPLDLYDNPGNVFVAGFIGSPAMNFIKGKIDSKDGRQIFVSDTGSVLPADGARAASRSPDRTVRDRLGRRSARGRFHRHPSSEACTFSARIRGYGLFGRRGMHHGKLSRKTRRERSAHEELSGDWNTSRRGSWQRRGGPPNPRAACGCDRNLCPRSPGIASYWPRVHP